MSTYFLYFDPGIGAMIAQSIIAAVAGVLIFSKNLIYRIKSFFGIKKVDDDSLIEDIEDSNRRKK